MICAILMGRDGSTGFAGKNVHPLAGLPLVAWALKAAQETPEIERIYVTTDSPRIKEISLQYGARVIDRPAHLCTKEALGEHVYVHAHGCIREELAREGQKPTIYALLMANAPTVSPAQISEGIRALQNRPDVDSAVTVSIYNMWSPLRARKLDGDGLLKPFVPFEVFGDPKTLNCDRDSQGDTYFADMGVSVIRAQNLDDLDRGMLPQKWMGQRILPIQNVGGLDVDYDYQMPQAEWWLKVHGLTD